MICVFPGCIVPVYSVKISAVSVTGHRGSTILLLRCPCWCCETVRKLYMLVYFRHLGCGVREGGVLSVLTQCLYAGSYACCFQSLF